MGTLTRFHRQWSQALDARLGRFERPSTGMNLDIMSKRQSWEGPGQGETQAGGAQNKRKTEESDGSEPQRRPDKVLKQTGSTPYGALGPIQIP
jgi:hypothetical protein